MEIAPTANPTNTGVNNSKKIENILKSKMQDFNNSAKNNSDYQRILELIKQIASTIKQKEKLTKMQILDRAANIAQDLGKALS